MKAIISDIHANLEALIAVLEDIGSKNIREIICLGDTIGYGPNPRECLLIIKNQCTSVMGNHEEALIYRPLEFSNLARDSIKWTKQELTSPRCDPEQTKEIWDFLSSLPSKFSDESITYLHGAPESPIRNYILAEDILDTEKMVKRFSSFDKILFCGHSHLPGVFTEDLDYIQPKDCDYNFKLNGKKVIVNVGSVGQPRDKDNRASYVTFDGEKITFHRIEYDFKKTVEKLLSISSLPPFLAERLKRGL